MVQREPGSTNSAKGAAKLPEHAQTACLAQRRDSVAVDRVSGRVLPSFRVSNVVADQEKPGRG